MRSSLAAITSISNIETDVTEQTCQFSVSGDVDVDALLKDLAENNSRIVDWSREK